MPKFGVGSGVNMERCNSEAASVAFTSHSTEVAGEGSVVWNNGERVP